MASWLSGFQICLYIIRHREDILRFFSFSFFRTAVLFFEVLHVGVSYISMSNVCFWHRSSSLVEVVYITVLGLKQDLALKKCCIAFSIKKNQ